MNKKKILFVLSTVAFLLLLATAVRAFTTPLYVSEFSAQWNGSDLAVDTSGNIFRCNYASSTTKVDKFDSSGTTLATGCPIGSGTGQCTNSGNYNACWLAADNTGRVWVADTYANKVHVFDNDLNSLFDFGSTGTDPSQFNHPSGIAIDSGNNRVFISDATNTRIQVFDLTGAFQYQFGSSGAGDGQFSGQTLGIDVDPTGQFVYVSDPGPERVQKFTEAGTYQTQWSANGSAWVTVKDATVDSTGDVYVTEVFGPRVQVFDPNGVFLAEFIPHSTTQGSPGNGDIAGMDFALNGDLYMTPWFGYYAIGTVMLFSQPTPTPAAARHSEGDIPPRRPEDITPTPTPVSTSSPQATPSPSPTPSATPSPSQSPTPSATPSHTPLPSVSLTPTPTQIVIVPIESPSLPPAAPTPAGETQSFAQAISQTLGNLIDAATNTVAPIAVPPLADTATAVAVATTAAALATGFAQNGAVAATHGFFQIIGIKRKTRVWGVVYDSATKHPIPFVKVMLLDASGRILETRFADRDGRYGFLTSPTSLHQTEMHVSIHAEKPGYTFPSFFTTSTSDYIVYDRLYKGDLLTITKATVLNFSIPMDPTTPHSQSISTFSISLMGTLGDKILNLGFYIGCLAVPISYAMDPSYKNLIIAILFISMNAFRLLAVYRPYGVIKDAQTGKPLPYALVTLTDEAGYRIAFSVSDEYGRFMLSGSPHTTYTLTAYTPANTTQRSASAHLSKLFGRGWVTRTMRV